MKKSLLTILLAGLIFPSCYNSDEDLLEKIEKERQFKIRDYEDYRFPVPIKDEEKGIIYICFDLNRDGRIDAIAKTTMTKKKGKRYSVNPYAIVLAIDKDKDGDYEIFYVDKNGDTILETKDEKPLIYL